MSIYDQINKWDYIIMLQLLLFSSKSNALFNNPVYLIIPIMIILIIFLRRGFHFDSYFIKIIFVYLIFIIGYFIKYSGEFDPMFSYRIFSYILLAYLSLRCLGYLFFKIYEDVIYIFALISLPLFIIQVINFSFTHKILSNIQHFIGINTHAERLTNIIIYTLNTDSQRNCGFTFEPGPFSIFLIFAIIFHLSNNNFNLKSKRLFIFLITLITTFSTTGYLNLLIVFLWYILNSKKIKTWFAITISLPIVIYVLSLPFMIEKVNQLSSNPYRKFDQTIKLAQQTGNNYSMGRFTGALLDLKDLKNHPIIGYGGHKELSFSMRNKIEIYAVNGITGWLAEFGLLGFILLIYTYYRSSRNFIQLYQIRYHIIIFLIFFTSFFAFGLNQTMPIFFAFQISFFLLPADNNSFSWQS